MRGTDKFLIGTVVGVAVLVGAAFIVALTRPEPTYQPENTPEGVVHNYLFALQQGSLKHAYGYISPTITNYPASASEFSDLVMNNRWMLRLDADDSVTLHVESSKINGKRATAYVRETRFHSGGLFASSQDIQTFTMQLRHEDGGWKITDADSYWLHCLRDKDECSR